jgi:redox-regulated HSP33 family molecular chaperone
VIRRGWPSCEPGLEKGGLAKIMEAEPVATLAALAPDAVVIDQLSLAWKCRCSEERVLASLRMLEATDLAEMIAAEVPVVVDCDLCAKKYEIQVDQIRQLFAQMIKAEG